MILIIVIDEAIYNDVSLDSHKEIRTKTVHITLSQLLVKQISKCPAINKQI